MRGAPVSSFLIGSVLICAVASTADLSGVSSGTRVRVELSLDRNKLTGRYVGCDAESVTLLVDGASRAIRREQIQQFAVSGGRPSRMRRAVVGAGIGAASGVPAAAFAGEWHIVGPLALFGAVIGASVPAHEKWHTVDVGRAKVTCYPHFRRGPGIAVMVAF